MQNNITFQNLSKRYVVLHLLSSPLVVVYFVCIAVITCQYPSGAASLQSATHATSRSGYGRATRN